jgi:hypothetical protein
LRLNYYCSWRLWPVSAFTRHQQLSLEIDRGHAVRSMVGKIPHCADSRPSRPRPGTGRFDPQETFAATREERPAARKRPFGYARRFESSFGVPWPMPQLPMAAHRACPLHDRIRPCDAARRTLRADPDAPTPASPLAIGRSGRAADDARILLREKRLSELQRLRLRRDLDLIDSVLDGITKPAKS